MRTKALSLSVFLLMALCAAAENTLSVVGSDIPLGSSSWSGDASSWFNVEKGTISWDATAKKLVLHDVLLKWDSPVPALSIKGTNPVTIEVVGKNTIEHTSEKATIECSAIVSEVTLNFKGTGTLNLMHGLRRYMTYSGDIRFLRSKTDLIVDGPSVYSMSGDIVGANDMSTRIKVLSGELILTTSRNSSGYPFYKIAGIDYGRGIGLKTPHGAYIGSNGNLMTIDGETVYRNYSSSVPLVSIGSVTDYGFSICGHEVNESNVDLLDEWARYSLLEGSIKFDWKSNTIYLDNATISSDVDGPVLANRTNGGLKLNVKGNCTLRSTKSKNVLDVNDDLEVNGTGVLYLDCEGKSGNGQVIIGNHSKLTVLSSLKAGYINGLETQGDNDARLCIEDNNGLTKGDITLNGGFSNIPTLAYVKLVDHWGNESKLPVRQTSNSVYSMRPVYVHNGGKSGVYYNDMRGNFYVYGLVINDKTTIYPVEINGRYVTDYNADHIIVPEMSYSNNKELSYDPKTNTLTMVNCNLSSLSSGNTPIIKNNDATRQLNIVLKGTNTATCYAKCPFVESVSNVSFANLNSDAGPLTITKSGSEDSQCGMIDAEGQSITFQDLRNMKAQYVNANKIGVYNSNLEIAETGGKYDPNADVFYTSCETKDVNIDTSYGYAYLGALLYGVPAGKDWLVTGHEKKVRFSRAEATEYDVWLGGHQVTSFNKDNIAFPGLTKGKVTYDPETGVMRLIDASLKNRDETEPTIKFVGGTHTIYSIGTSTIRSQKTANLLLDGAKVSTGGHALTIIGNVEAYGFVRLTNNSTFTIVSPEKERSTLIQYVESDNTNNTLSILSLTRFLGNGVNPTVSVKNISLTDVEVKSPYSIGDGVIVDGNGQTAKFEVQIVAEGTNPVYPTAITMSCADPTIAKWHGATQVTADIQPSNVTDKSIVWTSSDEGVATVSADGLVSAVANGVTTISATGSNGIKGTVDITVDIPDPNVITLDKTDIWFKSDYSGEYITATIGPDDCDPTVAWTSSNEDVVTVGGTGNTALIRRIADEGTATITATAVNGLTAQCQVRVHYPKYAKELTLSENTVRLTDIGEEVKVQATVGPDDIDYDLLGYWLDKSGDTEVADVSIAADGTLTIVAKKEGNMGVAVHATCDGEENLTGAYAHMAITVKPVVTATALTLWMSDNKFYQYDESRTIFAEFTPGDVDSRELEWSSSDNSVASVDENGVVTSISEGTCTITAKTTDGSNLEAKQIIYVYFPDDYAIVIPDNIGISLSRQELTLFPNQHFEIYASLSPGTASTYVTWEVEALEGDDGRVEVSPYGDVGDEIEKSHTAELAAYVWSPSSAAYPIRARVKATAIGAAQEPLATATCDVTILGDIYFTQANGDGVDISYHVLNADPLEAQVELYGTTKVQKVNDSWTEVSVPAIDTETTGTLTIPSQVTYDGQTYWVTTLGSGSLVKNKVEHLVLPEGLTTIMDGAVGGGYNGYEGYLKSVTLPSTLKLIGSGAFNSQSGLKDVYMEAETVPTRVDQWGNDTGSAPDDAFSGIAADAVLHIPYGQLDTWNQWPWSDWFSDIDDGSYLTASTAEEATMSFHITSMAQLTAEVKGKPAADLSTRVKAVADDVTEVTIPAHVGKYKVTSISENAFAELASLKCVTIPASIATIEAGAFENCEKLDAVTIYCMTPPSTGSGAFSRMSMSYEQRKLMVPYGCRQAYEEAGWGHWFGIIEEMEMDGYVPDTDIALADNIIYTQKMELKAGQKAALSIRMKNSVPIRTFQFKLFLPDGVEAVKNSKNKYIASLNRERLDEYDEHTLYVGKQSDGSILFICSTMYDEDFAAGHGEVISVPVQAAADLADGDYAVTLQQVVLKGSDDVKVSETSVLKSTIVIGKGGEPSDVNNDGSVDVADIATVITVMTGAAPELEDAADVNVDGTVDVADIATIITRMTELARRQREPISE